MQQLLKTFEKYISATRARSTAYRYVHEADRFMRWAKTEGYSNLEKLPRNTLKNYGVYLIGRGYRPTTLNTQLVSVKSFLNWCRVEGLDIKEFHPPDLPRITVKVKDIVSADKFPLYFEEALYRPEPIRTAVMLLPCSGLRAYEMVSLPLKSLKRTPLRLANGKQKQTLTILLKGKRGDERLVPLLDEGAQVVMRYLKGWRKGHPDTRWMFPGRGRNHVTDRALRAALQKVRERLGMQFTPHTMRRTYLTTLYKAGVEPVVLARIAGHKNIKTLMNHYLFLDEYDLAGAVHSTGGRLIGERHASQKEED